MTDKINDKKLESMKGEPLNPQDEELLQMFFSDCQMSEIPDDGFSDRVMQALPALPDTDTAMSLVKRQRLEHLWTAACVAAGIIIAVVCQGWEQIQGWLFSMKIDFLLSGSRALTHVADSIAHSQNLLMVLAGIANFRRMRTGPRIAHPMAVTISVNNTSDMISHPFQVFFVQLNHTCQIS